MRTDKDLAFELRKKGKTYRQIQKEMGIARSTLCGWFRDEPWSAHIRKINTDKHIEISTEHLKRLNEGRRKWLETFYAKLDAEADVEFQVFVKDSLFVAGLMLYAGEGDKSDTVTVRFTNCDLDLHKIFKLFTVRYLESNSQKLKFRVLSYPDIDLETCLTEWSTKLSIRKENFYKTQVIVGRHKTRRLQFGVGTIILVGTKYKRKLSRWIEKYKELAAPDAAMV